MEGKGGRRGRGEAETGGAWASCGHVLVVGKSKGRGEGKCKDKG